jgi:purine-binding chemotaxis protein CheW
LDSIATVPDVTPAVPTLLFRVGGAAYGCDVRCAQEILTARPMTRLPGAPAYVRGLINLRGTIVTVIDLGARLDSTTSTAPDATILLVRHHDRLVGVAVDEVTDVRAVSIGQEPSSETGGASHAWGSRGVLVRGIADVDGESAIILDLESLITHMLVS